MAHPMACEEGVVVATRLHWNNHAHDQAIDDSKLLSQVIEFLARAETYAKGILLAVWVPPVTTKNCNIQAEAAVNLTTRRADGATADVATETPALAASTTTSVFEDSVRSFYHKLQQRIASSTSSRSALVMLVPISYWGNFVPALNALVCSAANSFPMAKYILFQSLEMVASLETIRFLKNHFDDSQDLVVGAALPGHDFAVEATSNETECALACRPLNGCTSPWNTLALWSLPLLAKLGFPLVAEGLCFDAGASGVEEVATIAVYQRLFPKHSVAKVVEVPGLKWMVDDLQDPKRNEWQRKKMQSKMQRAEKQLKHLEFATVGHSSESESESESPAFQVIHIATTSRH